MGSVRRPKMSKCAGFLLLLALSGASAASLTVKAHYPWSKTSLIVHCKAHIALGAGILNYGDLDSDRSETMVQQPSKVEWTSSVNYRPQDVGRRVQLTFMIVFNFSLTAAPAEFSACAKACPAVRTGLGLQNLGAPVWVNLKEGGTQVDAWPYFCTQRGKVATQTLYSPELATNRTLTVYRPLGLVENTLPRPSAMAVKHDGQEFVPLQLNTILDAMIISGEIQELVVVGVNSWSTGAADPMSGLDYRNGILTPFKQNDTCVCNTFLRWSNACNLTLSGATGRGDDYANFLVKQILPTVSAQLGVTLDRRTTISWGYSLGGLTAAYHAYAYPKTFGIAIAGSPSLWFNCGELVEPLVTLVPSSSKLYLDVGNAEPKAMHTLPRVVYQRLLQRDTFRDGANVWLTEGEGDYHNPNAFYFKRGPRALKAVLPGESRDQSHYEPPKMDWGPTYGKLL